ncbi:hypothetical protein [uncultured Mucilaginibacter sp.]|uniref:hypothetical protein n=1 Tax=uncultured Mucilaginibacter sp. TaxID=797541 RepID=UPI0025EBD9D3|nr:hypothetical protein [uncultured Mucilaginibacter sp.]
MKRRIFTTMALVCCIMVCFAAIADMTGKWTGMLKTPDGNDLQINFIFTVDGDKLTGTAQGDGDPVPIDSGRISGNEFSFTAANPQGVVFKHSGKFFGDSVSMNIDVNGTKLHATLKRDDK